MQTQQEFWNQWAAAYREFSETIEPYRVAQQTFARATILALKENLHQNNLTLLDVGGGAGNLISPLLDMLLTQRGHLKGVNYILTDSADTMLSIVKERLTELNRKYPEVKFRVVQTDTLNPDFTKSIGQQTADVVVNSWNIEYYPPERRPELVAKLVQLAHARGVVAFSSIVRLPDGLTIREVLMPLGRAQVFHALLTGGPRKMRHVIHGLKQIAEFGAAAAEGQFPPKPTLAELHELARQAGLDAVLAHYHLYGASGMVIARKDSTPFPHLPKLPIAQALAGKAGYDGDLDTLTLWGYLWRLVSSEP